MWIIDSNNITNTELPKFKITFYDEYYTLCFGNHQVYICKTLTLNNLFIKILHYTNYCNKIELFTTFFTNYTKFKNELYDLIYKINPTFCDEQYEETLEIITSSQESLYIHKFKKYIIFFVPHKNVDYGSIFYKIIIYNKNIESLLNNKKCELYYDDIVDYIFPLGPKSANKLV
jgi:hypothetical protein